MLTQTKNVFLTWEDFQENVCRSFSDLREDTELSDVTLVCNDNQLLRAHKVVLSSSSSLLSPVLRSLSQSQPLLFLLGVTVGQAAAVLDFCYRGQVTLNRLDVEDFFRVAKLLRIKGVTGAGSGDEIRDINPGLSKTEDSKIDYILPENSKIVQNSKMHTLKETVVFDESQNVENIITTGEAIQAQLALQSGVTNNIVMPIEKTKHSAGIQSDYIKEKQLLFALRSYSYKAKTNFKKLNGSNLNCKLQPV